MPRAARPQQSGTAAAPVSHKSQESIPSSSSGVNVIEQQSSQNLNLSAPAMSEQSSAPDIFSIVAQESLLDALQPTFSHLVKVRLDFMLVAGVGLIVCACPKQLEPLNYIKGCILLILYPPIIDTDRRLAEDTIWDL